MVIPTSRDFEKYLILPGRKHGNYEYPDLLVSTTRTHSGDDWDQAHKSLEQEDSFMLTLRQYVDFLKLLKSGNAHDGKGKKVDKTALEGILDDIITVRTPWRAEWLDAEFGEEGGIFGVRRRMYIAYHRIRQDGSVEIFKEPLKDTLMQDKKPGISLDDWLANANHQGLPISSILGGTLYYWHPQNRRVARFYANSGWASLSCIVSPSSSSHLFRVRAARLKK